MIEPRADNIVLKQLPRLIADAERLVAVAAWADLPAGLRIIDIDGRQIAGFSLGSGHNLAQAHGCREGVVAVGVAAEAALRASLAAWADDLPAALGEAALAIEAVAAHEAAHALIAEPDALGHGPDYAVLRRLPAAVGTVPVVDSAERTARDHQAAWAAALIILSHRCMQYRPGARHRWPDVIHRDLEAHGIDAQAVADAVGDVADEHPLRELLAAGSVIVERVAAAIPDDAGRAALIAARRNESTPADPGHVAPVAAGAA